MPHPGDYALKLADRNAEDAGGLLAVAPGMAQNIGHMGIVILLQCA
jgi:hypothetical protein